MSLPIIVLDNGAYNIKIGTATPNATPKLVPNAIIRGQKKNYIGDEFEECQDRSSLYYRLPFEKGLLVNWGIERTIWDRLFKEPKDKGILITEPYFNLMGDSYDQMIFEEYEFESCYRTTTAGLCLYQDLSELFGDRIGSIPDVVLVVDSGYSFTHIIPFFKGKSITKGIKRLNVGGKVLTNHLKELVSFRYYDMMEETYIINDVKEQCCYISKDIYQDLNISKKPKNPIIQEYVLPDFTTITKGYILKNQDQAEQQILTMNNERFMVPEILMHPSDIGINQAGIPEAIQQSVESCDPSIHGLLYANILLVGGNTNIPGYKDRIKQDLIKLISSEYNIRVASPKNPITFSWEGGNSFINSNDLNELKNVFVSRKEYMEYGSNICKNKFNFSI